MTTDLSPLRQQVQTGQVKQTGKLGTPRFLTETPNNTADAGDTVSQVSYDRRVSEADTDTGRGGRRSMNRKG